MQSLICCCFLCFYSRMMIRCCTYFLIGLLGMGLFCGLPCNWLQKVAIHYSNFQLHRSHPVLWAQSLICVGYETKILEGIWNYPWYPWSLQRLIRRHNVKFTLAWSEIELIHTSSHYCRDQRRTLSNISNLSSQMYQDYTVWIIKFTFKQAPEKINNWSASASWRAHSMASGLTEDHDIQNVLILIHLRRQIRYSLKEFFSDLYNNGMMYDMSSISESSKRVELTLCLLIKRCRWPRISRIVHMIPESLSHTTPDEAWAHQHKGWGSMELEVTYNEWHLCSHLQVSAKQSHPQQTYQGKIVQHLIIIRE